MLSDVGKTSGSRIAPAIMSRITTPRRAYSWIWNVPPDRPNGAAAGGLGDGAHRISSGTDSGSGDGVTKQLELGRLLAGDLGDQLALAHHEDAAAEADQLGQLRGDDEHATPGLGELGDELVDLRLRADVDPARGLVEEQHPAVAHQPAREDHLLLVAARQLACERARVVGLGIQRSQLLAGGLALGPRAQQGAAAELAQVGDRDVARAGTTPGAGPATSDLPGASPRPAAIAA